MNISKPSLNLLEQLGSAGVEEPSESLGDLLTGIKSFQIPADLAGTEEAGWIHLTDQTLGLYNGCLDALANEPELEHITRSDVDRELRALFCDLHVNRDDYQLVSTRSKRLKRFLNEILKPHEEFEIIHAIDGLRLDANSLTIGDVTFYQLGQQMAEEWGIYDSPVEGASELVGKVVGILRLSAGSQAKAVEKAREKLDTALNALRVSLAAFPGYYIHDDPFFLVNDQRSHQYW